MSEPSEIIPIDRIKNSIFSVRKQKVMIDRDLAELYGVETKTFNQAVKRNIKRFPQDFMFQLTKVEKDQLVTNCDRFKPLKHSSSMPYAFTEQGIAMLASILNSERAIEVNIAIVRTFVKLRKILADNALLRRKIESMECKYDEQFQHVFAVLNQMLTEEPKPKRQIGYHTEGRAHNKQVQKRKAKSKKTSKKKTGK